VQPTPVGASIKTGSLAMSSSRQPEAQRHLFILHVLLIIFHVVWGMSSLRSTLGLLMIIPIPPLHARSLLITPTHPGNRNDHMPFPLLSLGPCYANPNLCYNPGSLTTIPITQIHPGILDDHIHSHASPWILNYNHSPAARWDPWFFVTIPQSPPATRDL
jgi:hypothetical protein